MVAWQIKNKSIVTLLGTQSTSSFHSSTCYASLGMQLLVSSQRQQTTDCEVKSTLCGSFWPSGKVNGVNWWPLFTIIPPISTRESLIVPKKLKFYCLAPVLSLLASEGVNLKSSVENTEKSFKEPHLGFYQGPRRAMGTYSQKVRVSNLEFLCFFCWQA